MLVMVSNQSNPSFRRWAKEYPGRIGHLFSINGQRKPLEHFPWALDNGAFTAYKRNELWNEEAYLKLVAWAERQETQPLWALVPDVVGSRDLTIASWEQWRYKLKSRGWKLAFALQDGMTTLDIPEDASVLFLGGSVEWKRKTLDKWGNVGLPLHVGRINTVKWLWRCVEAGAVSVDGTGWWHKNKRQLWGLEEFLQAYAEGWRHDPNGS